MTSYAKISSSDYAKVLLDLLIMKVIFIIGESGIGKTQGINRLVLALNNVLEDDYASNDSGEWKEYALMKNIKQFIPKNKKVKKFQAIEVCLKMQDFNYGDIYGIVSMKDDETCFSGHPLINRAIDKCKAINNDMHNETAAYIVIVLDELNRISNPNTANQIMAFIDNRNYRAFDFPQPMTMVATGNPVDSENFYQVSEFNVAMMARFAVYNFVTSKEIVLKDSERLGFNQMSIDFLRTHFSENDMVQFVDGHQTWSPRKLEEVSDLTFATERRYKVSVKNLTNNPKIVDIVKNELYTNVAGVSSEIIAAKYVSFIQNYIEYDVEIEFNKELVWKNISSEKSLIILKKVLMHLKNAISGTIKFPVKEVFYKNIESFESYMKNNFAEYLKVLHSESNKFCSENLEVITNAKEKILASGDKKEFERFKSVVKFLYNNSVEYNKILNENE